MKAVFKREMRAYFTMPIGYIVIAVILILTGMYFSYMCQSSYSNISFVFSSISSIALLMAPIITMRLFSEDRKQKVDQALFTAPVKLISIICGKFLAAFALFMIPMSITLIYQIILSFVADVNWLLYLSDIVGIALMGAAILSIGLFISALTESQMIAGVFTFASLLLIYFISWFESSLQNEIAKEIVSWFSLLSRYSEFQSGILNFENIIYYLSFIFVFLFLTVRVIDKRRYS